MYEDASTTHNSTQYSTQYSMQYSIQYSTHHSTQYSMQYRAGFSASLHDVPEPMSGFCRVRHDVHGGHHVLVPFARRHRQHRFVRGRRPWAEWGLGARHADLVPLGVGEAVVDAVVGVLDLGDAARDLALVALPARGGRSRRDDGVGAGDVPPCGKEMERRVE